MSNKKCKMCCEDAKWKWNGEYYCQFCLCTELEVWQRDMPLVCEMCRADLGREYYTDSEGYTFCSPECALEFNDAKKLGEENGDNESGN